MKCLGQPAQISLDSAVLTVRSASIDNRRVQPVVAIFQLVFHFASKLNCHLFNCCVDYALMYDTMYALISTIITATCSGCFVYSLVVVPTLQWEYKICLSHIVVLILNAKFQVHI